MASYKVDNAHSDITFSVRHMVFAKVRGHFTKWTAQVSFDPKDPSKSAVEASIDAASIDTREAQRDGHLKSADFLDAENHPKLTLKSTGLRRTGDTRFVLSTDFTVRGVTRPVDFDVEYLGTGPGMAPDSEVIALEASAEVDRRDFGVSFSAALDGGGLIVGNKVKIELSIEAHKQ